MVLVICFIFGHLDPQGQKTTNKGQCKLAFFPSNSSWKEASRLSINPVFLHFVLHVG